MLMPARRLGGWYREQESRRQRTKFAGSENICGSAPHCPIDTGFAHALSARGTCLATFSYVEIQFISSLTADDEKRLAPGLLDLVCAILDELPVAYTLRIRTTTGETIQRTKAEALPPDATDGG